jgi:hypothetical protein
MACFKRIALGLPDSNEAFEMALNKDYPHAAVYYARQGVGSAWGKLSEAELRHRFLSKYAYYCNKVMEGEKLYFPQEIKQLDEPINIDYKDYKAKIAARFGEKIANKHCDHA